MMNKMVIRRCIFITVLTLLPPDQFQILFFLKVGCEKSYSIDSLNGLCSGGKRQVSRSTGEEVPEK